jgi:hypothetical protein
VAAPIVHIAYWVALYFFKVVKLFLCYVIALSGDILQEPGSIQDSAFIIKNAFVHTVRKNADVLKRIVSDTYAIKITHSKTAIFAYCVNVL